MLFDQGNQEYCNLIKEVNLLMIYIMNPCGERSFERISVALAEYFRGYPELLELTNLIIFLLHRKTPYFEMSHYHYPLHHPFY